MNDQKKDPKIKIEAEQAIEPEYKEKMVRIAKYLTAELKDDQNHTGFCLLVFPLGKKGRLNFISNAERESMMDGLKEFIIRHEMEKAQKQKLAKNALMNTSQKEH